MERIHPQTHQCPFGVLCMSSLIALLLFVFALLLVA